MAKYDISREAAEDLYNIWEYTCDTWSAEQANAA
jgi:plasmid stabilization system protein ParE